MSIVNTGNFPKALVVGVKAWYGQAYDEYPVEWTRLVDQDTSNRNFEEFVGFSGFGLPQVKTEGGPITYDTERQGFTTRFTHVVYANGFIITREMIEDDQYDVVGKRRAQALAFGMRQGKETVVANVYNRAFNSSYTGGDGKELLATDHPNVAGGTWANEPTTAADLSEAVLEQASIDIQGFTDDRGLKISIKPRALIVTPSQEFDAMRILKSVGRVGTDLNDINALKEMGMFPDGVVVNHYLTDADAWFIRTNIPKGKGLLLLQRRAMEFDEDNDFDTENAKFKATERYSVGWVDPRCAYGSPGA